MRRILTLLAVAAYCSLSLPARAASDNIDGSTDGGSATVGAAAGSGIVSTGDGSGGGGGNGPVCTWERVKRGDLAGLGGLGGGGGPALSADEQAEPSSVDVDGVAFHQYTVSCPGQQVQFRLVDPNVAAVDLFALVTDEANRRIPLPQHDMNPTPDVGSVVNLGLWLAVEAQAVEPITAEAGPAWITATPTITNVAFDMGNGHTVNCRGLGVPYPWNDDPDEGPCGYTYRKKLPDDAAYTVTVTTTWTIPYTSSSGSGTLDPIQTSTSFSYDVDEIQTVGASPG